MNYRQFLVRLWCVSIAGICNAESWVRLYRLSPAVPLSSQTEQITIKTDIRPFNQFLFCWNALRPKVGYFSFCIRARDVRTQQWGKWHTMATWGNNKQESYFSGSDGLSKFVYVRLEMEPPHRANAFAIKVTAHDGADLAFIKRLYGTAVDIDAFKPEDVTTILLPGCMVYDVPKIAQLRIAHPHCNKMCSPTSAAMLAGYITGNSYDPLEFAHRCYDYGLQVYGSWPFNIAHAFALSAGASFYCNTRLNSFSELHAYLMRSLPVVVSVRGQLSGALKSFDRGHLLVVVGYDAEARAVICHDPAAYEHADVLKKYPLADFIRAWERSRRLAYVAFIDE